MIAAAVVLVAQNWGSMSLGVQIAVLGVTALVAGGVALVVAHGAGPGSARRRLAGVLFVGAAVSAAGTTALLVGEDTDYTGIAAFAVALAVMVGAHLVASSTITELGDVRRQLRRSSRRPSRRSARSPSTTSTTR